MRDRVVTDYIRNRLSIQNEENWSQDGTWGTPQVRSEGELLLVSCLAGRNGRRTGQDHEYQKCFRGESEECYGRLSKAALRSKSVRIEPEPDNRV